MARKASVRYWPGRKGVATSASTRATVYKHLDIDPHTFLYDQEKRPIPILPFGDPIRELI